MLQSLQLPPRWMHQHLDETDSTMSRIMQMPSDMIPADGALLLTADHQTAGHGQRGTSWESAPGANLLFSFAICPQSVKTSEQFFLSEALALAVAEALAPCTGECEVKWPNDVYHEDRKICGMLLQHTLSGDSIARTNVGVGVNVNQREFRSDAPNPVSVWQIRHEDTSRERLLESIINHFASHYADICQHHSELVHKAYLQRLYRREGFHRYRDAEGREFEARISGISPLGVLSLTDQEGRERPFAFKEVSFVIEE